MTTQYLRTILIHIPIGLGAMTAFLVHWVATLSIIIGFLTYEVVEMVILLLDKWINEKCLRDVLDRAYPEIAGMMIGLGIGATVIWILNYLGVDLHFVWK